MAFKDFPDQAQSVQLLQRSLERQRLAHAYLFTGDRIEDLEALSLTLAKTLNCLQPKRGASGASVDCCDQCLNCRKIADGNHADVHWVRAESKSRIIRVEEMRDLMREINLKPTEAEYKIAVIVAADRLTESASNAFLKTLEEPPPKSILILITTEPQRLLETIVSRCLRLAFAGDLARTLSSEDMEWLTAFNETAVSEQKTLLGRYRLMDALVQKLAGVKSVIEENLTARSPLQRYDDVEKEVRERWEDELTAAIEAEYRRQRAELLAIVQRWLRDIWLRTISNRRELLNFPELENGSSIAARISPGQALSNLDVIERTQRLLHTNVQEALALEVGLLKLHL